MAHIVLSNGSLLDSNDPFPVEFLNFAVDKTKNLLCGPTF